MNYAFCMRWINQYQLFLFDFDGILVNTEELHYQAYQEMCLKRGFTLDWDWRTYIQHGMFSATGLKEGIYNKFPDLKKQEPFWDVLYQEKKKLYLDSLKRGVPLMPGVADLLAALEKGGVKRCVVTHSPLEQIELIRSQHPILRTIPLWLTREDYSQPKPSPECYQKAIEKLGSKGDAIIGFEDSPRGLEALLKAGAKGVFISSLFKPTEVEHLAQEIGTPFPHFSSFIECNRVMNANQK